MTAIPVPVNNFYSREGQIDDLRQQILDNAIWAYPRAVRNHQQHHYNQRGLWPRPEEAFRIVTRYEHTRLYASLYTSGTFPEQAQLSLLVKGASAPTRWDALQDLLKTLEGHPVID